MRIAVTGASGFIGQCFLRSYCGEFEFVAFASNPAKEGLLKDSNIHYVELRYDDEESMNSALQSLDGCDAVVNLGFARSKSGVRERLADYYPSITVTERLFEECERRGIRNIVHASTQAVYSKQLPVPHGEDEPVGPFSFYGAAKVAAEALASVYNQSFGMNIKVLRFAQVLGNNEHQGVVAAYARAMREGRDLTVWGKGDESSREYVYVRDICSAIYAALHHETPGTYNIGTGTMTDAATLATIIASLKQDGSCKVVVLPDKKVEIIDFCMKSQKASDELGWHAEYGISEALEAMEADTDQLF